MDVPGALYLKCPECKKETLHEVLKGRGSERGPVMKLSALVKCSGCSAVRRVELREETEKAIEAVVSDAGVSARTVVKLDPASPVSLDDVVAVDGVPCLVTAIEVGTVRRREAIAKDISTLWLKRYDKVKVKLSINTGRRTVSRELWASPEEEFEVGDILGAGDMKVLIHSISAGGRRVRRGTVKAAEVSRMYGREVE